MNDDTVNMGGGRPEAPASAFPPGEYTTRDGRKAKAFAILDGYLFGAIEDGNGGWSSHIWMLDGRPATRKVRVRVAVSIVGENTLVAHAAARPDTEFDESWLNLMPDGKPAEIEVEIIDRRTK